MRLVTVGFLAALLSAGSAQADDIQTLYDRRLPFIVAGSSSSGNKTQTYLTSLRADGTWPDVNYTTGCNAQRANWPASQHWYHLLAVAAAYHGGVDGADQYVKNPDVRAAISRAMEYWFANDFSTIGNGACMDSGGVQGGLCPCGTPGLWNTNWFSNVILIPGLVGDTCVLLRDELSPTELGNCTLITARAYTPFYRNPPPGYVSGANILDMASVGVSAGLLENNRTGNASRISDAYERVHNEVVIQPEYLVDGIKPDGSFQQHSGLIYDGNYGKDFSNAVIQMELQAVGTQFQAAQSIKDAFGQHIGGARWMTFVNTLTKVVHWDMTVIVRMISWPVSNNQASSNLKMNLTQVTQLGEAWNQDDLTHFGTDLADANPKTANAGSLNGNRLFWYSDYMVHRTQSTVTTVRMLSNRTATSECVNSQNPKGFHLADGAVYTYTTGAEYEDMYATFDFNIVPGTTTDYGNTPLTCNTTQQYGVDSYAGGTSTGSVGIAAMRYKNPLTGALSFNKAYFFFDDNVQHVLVNNIVSTSPAPVFSVLDQRLRTGDIYVDSQSVTSGNYSNVKSLWHAGTGYVFPEAQDTDVSVEAETKTGSWASIGTSTKPLSTKDMFSAWIVHDSANLTKPIEYSVFPATNNAHDFLGKAARCTPQTIANTDVVSAAVDSTRRTFAAAFWKPEGGTLYVPHVGLTLSVDKPIALVVKATRGGVELSVADPTHGCGSVTIGATWVAKRHRRNDCIGDYCLHVRRGYSGPAQVTLTIELPTGAMAGSTVTRKLGEHNWV
ncbi:polysaccharide lyase family 8 protein [Ceratobasidium sp. AG-Ba]|nr:polysaccharide lyase family 8 protein [Ceratobasidium sp. AG-Ba]